MVTLIVKWRAAAMPVTIHGWAKPIPAEGCTFIIKRSTEPEIDLRVERVVWKTHITAAEARTEVILECSLPGEHSFPGGGS